MRSMFQATFIAVALLCNPLLVGTASTAVPDGTDSSILVDASRDGGVWWSPQVCPCDPDADHQGKALADYLESLGFAVTELSRGETITSELLAPFDIVIRANESGEYTQSEIVVYQNYVHTGGKLLLLGDFVRPGEQDTLALSFGLLLQGISRGENVIDTFEPHPITEGVSPLPYGVGSGVVQFAPTAEILGHLSMGTYLDLDDDNVQDPEEPTAAAALGRRPFGQGEIVFSGDTNMWLTVPQPLVDNVISWLIQRIVPGPGTVCVVQIRSDGDVRATLANDPVDVAIVLEVPGNASIPVRCEDLPGLSIAVANQKNVRVSLQIEAFTNRGESLCTRPRNDTSSFVLPVHGARGVILGRDCLP